MARNTATSQRITGDFPSGLAYPCTLHCWAQAPDITTERCPFGLFNAAVSDSSFSMYFRGDIANDPIILRNAAQATVRTVSSASVYQYVAGTWYPITIRLTSTTDYDLFVNQSKFEGSTAAGTPASITTFSMGAYPSSGSYFGYLNDDLAKCAAWSIDLIDAEILDGLHKGISPRLIRPNQRVFYAPLVRNVQDIGRNSITLTDTGTTVAEHPRSYGM